MTRRFAVLGSPIAHSKSPAIHLAAYRVLGTDWEYGRAEVTEGGLRKFIEELDTDWDGFSVTMPLKEEAAKFADILDEPSVLTAATNTLVKNEQGTWVGSNTDIFGIVKSLAEAHIALPKRVLILGSGATATSAMAAVKEFSPRAEVRVWARNAVSRKLLVAFGRSLGLRVGSAGSLKRASVAADLTISTLPAGVLDDPARILANSRFWAPKGALLDVAYNPWPSSLATLWTSKGQIVVSGLEMLIWQAVAQIRIFFHGSPAKELPNEIAVVEAMRLATEN
jgi:shikimate dehydrogenase